MLTHRNRNVVSSVTRVVIGQRSLVFGYCVYP